VEKGQKTVRNNIKPPDPPSETNETRMTSRMKENTVYIGMKPVMSYVTAIITSFKENPESVVLRARGRAISNAVDAAEITRNRFLSGLTCEVSIGTEEMEQEDGGTRNVSTIAITLRKSHEAD